uniref:phosphoribosylamine--glycine ligase n=1 Tax=Marseillevirus LCMAC201 TaxID=2506605 RepID=A0A481YWZ7_9VIRU|nr:MAG: uncharacterized protein LCMAC201_05520 [Marseillevirus LCMAC201]
MIITKVLIIGTGGREHAIAKALSKSVHYIEIYALGGWVNPGIESIGHIDILDINSNTTIVEYAQIKEIDIVIIGSENQLAQGLADALNTAGIFCVGPTRELAQLETDKVYTRKLLPSQYNPKYRVFDVESYSLDKLKEYLIELDHQYVVKAVGIRGGKGVKVSDVHLKDITDTHDWCCKLIEEDGQVLIEERLFGEEFTLQAFTDAHSHLVNMPVVKDFKRLGDGDSGPNTGGMGCISFAGGSAPFLTPVDLATAQQVNQDILSKLPGYVGVLYGSFIKTSSGVKVIEYNCRFGDPEVINVLELLQTDLIDILSAMYNSSLDQLRVRWSTDAMITNYVVAPGYPDHPQSSDLILRSTSHAIFGKIIKVAGVYTQLSGRSVALWSRGKSVGIAYNKNQLLLNLVCGDCQYRTDIGKEVSLL